MSKVKLVDIQSLTFYADEKTAARRSSPIPQLTCVGKPCNLYKPDVVRCTNAGGSGVDVDWTCEADLPSSLRFGRVEVSCEGWSRPGDPYVLKGSCGLEYRLVRVSTNLENDRDYSLLKSRWSDPDFYLKWIFIFLWGGLLVFLAYKFIQSCLRQQGQATGNRPRRGGGGGGGWQNWFDTRGTPGNPGAPPPYSKDPPTGQSQSWWGPTNSTSQAQGWRPGFWTGLGAGGLLGQLFRPTRRVYTPAPSPWDWERPFGPRRTYYEAPPIPSPRVNDDRGEGSSRMGSSGLGATRRATGLGSSRVR